MIEYIVKVSKDGKREWYLNGEHHREDGPAIEHSDGCKYWYLNGKLHREDGPAVENANGDKYWFLNGKRHREEEFNKKINSKTIVIDGKEIVISLESYETLKTSLL